MVQELNEVEVHKVVFYLPKHKALVVDGIPMEFFHELWLEVSEDMTNLLQETFQEGSMNKKLSIELQTFIPKLGDQRLLTNYRPISVLGSTYKITPKTLTNWFQPFLLTWIRPSQTRFVQGRSILDNVFLAFEAMERGKESDQDLVFLLLDFEKAYDKVNWTFLQEFMRKIGFLDEWIQWTSSLYKNSESFGVVNGRRGEKFKMEKVVQQGCPIACYLHLFVANVLGYMISNPSYMIKGLVLLDGQGVRDQMFVDDTTLFLKGT